MRVQQRRVPPRKAAARLDPETQRIAEEIEKRFYARLAKMRLRLDRPYGHKYGREYFYLVEEVTQYLRTKYRSEPPPFPATNGSTWSEECAAWVKAQKQRRKKLPK